MIIPSLTTHRVIRNSRRRQSRGNNIPSVLYQTGESKRITAPHFRRLKTFRNLNGDLDHLFFDANARLSYMEAYWTDRKILDVYKNSLFGQLQADIFRYCIVFDRGGYYCDLNKSLRAPFTSFHPAKAVGLISFETNLATTQPSNRLPGGILHPRHQILQWSFGFEPQHPILAEIIEDIEKAHSNYAGRVFSSPKAAILSLSGPQAFTRAVWKVARGSGLANITQVDFDFGLEPGTLRIAGSVEPGPLHYSTVANKPILSDTSTPSPL